MENVAQTEISQYANSPVVVSLINSMNAALDPSTNLENFYNQIWNINTAVGYGLDLWGRIVGVQRVLQVSNTVYLGTTGPNGTSGDSMNVAPFYAGGQLTSNYALSDNDFRTLILAKAASNICNGSIPAINQILMALFGASGQCWCTDGQNMTMTYTFYFTPSAVQLAIIDQSGVLPRPCGVSVTVAILGEGLINDGGVLQLVSGAAGWPYSPTGLTPGALYSNGGVICVAGTTTPSGSAPPVLYSETNAVALLELGGSNLPLTNPGVAGQLWNYGGVVCISNSAGI